jgi:YebC/PmpR family DNA-binding regulatory protein
MSGHSKWAKTHRQKEATDAKRGAIFTKMGNLITIAAKEGGGGDLESNFKLRLAIEKAKSVNMPKDNIDRAVKRGTGEGGEGVILEEATYEAFGPASSTFIIETITDNKNRTISDVKIAVNKNGGQMGGANSVSWQFERKGLIIIDNEQIKNKDADELELELIDAGAEDIFHEEEDVEIITVSDQLQVVSEKIKNLGLEIKESSLIYKAKEGLNIEDENIKEKIGKLYSAIDDVDDVTNIYTNA